jgi:hypothetical protein
MKTITFNTGRNNGEQVITASSIDGRVITFKDPSRGLEYTFRNNPEWFTEEDMEMFGDWDESSVMSWYDGDRTNRPEVQPPQQPTKTESENTMKATIDKAKQFAKDNYESGFDVYVECYGKAEWEDEARDDNGKELTWAQLKAKMKEYVSLREELRSNCY